MKEFFQKRSPAFYLVSGAGFLLAVGLFTALNFKDIKTFKYFASVEEVKEPEKILHIPTPKPARGIYMTSWVAATRDWRSSMIDMIDKTELNSVVIDIKDYTGRIAFETDNSEIVKTGSIENRINDAKVFLDSLHEKNIYAVARISVFQDSYMVKERPDLAVKTKTGAVWKDRKGISWIDPCSTEYWDYIVEVSKEAEKIGFDELNFDYIRFPSDGDMKNIAYPFCGENFIKAEKLEEFFSYLKDNLKETNVPLSADLFGMVTVNTDDLNIGQVLEKAAPYFDYICPMVYPSHYPPTYDGFKNPADHPYEIIKKAMDIASQRLLAASSTPFKLRPWLQDFDLGANYTAEMVRKEKQAVYDAGLDSWLLWDPSNKYTKGALDK